MNTPLFSRAGSQAADAAARASGVAGFTLMQRAAAFAFEQLNQAFPNCQRLVLFCGKGHNGGDAFLVGELARELGMEVVAYDLAADVTGADDVARARAAALAAGVRVADFNDDPIAGDVIVDGLLGTGFHGEVGGDYARAIERINGSGLPVVSIDIPSGVDADNGAAATPAVKATITPTFITQKIGLQTGAGKGLAGRVAFTDLAVDQSLLPEAEAELIRLDGARWPALAADAYKHARGHVVVVGGDFGMPGAIVLASRAAMRVGAGMLTVVSQNEHLPVVVGATPEVMFRPAEDIEAALERADIVVLGPGLGRETFGEAAFNAVAASGLPTVLDADGLWWLAEVGHWQGGALCITPHAQEAARLLGCEASTVEADRVGSARQLAERFSAQVVLKGPGSVIMDNEGLGICGHGNPGMASAGMGDVLAGLLGGALAPSARSGTMDSIHQVVALHSAAADAATERVTQRGLLASDIIDELPAVMRAAGIGVF